MDKKKHRYPENSARNKAKENRYSGNGADANIACTHNGTSCAAVTLTEADLSYIKQQLYSTFDKVKQDAILLSHMDVTPCKRRRRQVEAKVPVCQTSFLSIFCKYIICQKSQICVVSAFNITLSVTGGQSSPCLNLNMCRHLQKNNN